MKKLIFAAAILIFGHISAQASQYAVQGADGVLYIIDYVDGSSKALDEIVAAGGLTGRPIRAITDSDLPDFKDRDFWKLNDVPIGPAIIVDGVKKQAHADAVAAKEAKKGAVLFKLKISKQELDDLTAK